MLIDNIGIQKPAAGHESLSEDFDRILGVNLRGCYLCSRTAIRHFPSREGGGMIVNDSSVHEIIPKPKYLSYSISKGGMEDLTESLALEYADCGIRVNAVGPWVIVTPINMAWIDNPAARSEVESPIPMGRAGEAEETAAVFAFLASDEASYITGQTLFAYGGLTLYPELRSPGRRASSAFSGGGQPLCRRHRAPGHRAAGRVREIDVCGAAEFGGEIPSPPRCPKLAWISLLRRGGSCNHRYRVGR